MSDHDAPIRTALRRGLRAALLAAVADPALPISAQGGGPAVRRAADAISEDAIERADLQPMLDHAANAEPWYRSRVTWGAILSGLTPLLALAGWRLTPEGEEAVVGAIVGIAPLISAALTLYGRWRATRPIGA